ncbi:hypothetical protein CTAM01_09812 [Colletotrichum tamarilloi]|uniref:Uncharacterized protein n=1 Tax=Colletotrichum tamarilloi TaxID=1209934 RepID=A0ABQ9R259_9PEZI|nr:uncharacterized protein CTAM01_09812 [Colletotrichum tamarilloi]KAK1492614.1 hypothetical protein CTAM01_09812 [Colletotrichum tamarilloi]
MCHAEDPKAGMPCLGGLPPAVGDTSGRQPPAAKTCRISTGTIEERVPHDDISANAQHTAFLPRQNQATTALDAIIPLFTNPENPATDTHLADVQLPAP